MLPLQFCEPLLRYQQVLVQLCLSLRHFRQLRLRSQTSLLMIQVC